MIFGLVFVSRDFDIDTVHRLRRVDRQSNMGLIYDEYVRTGCCMDWMFFPSYNLRHKGMQTTDNNQGVIHTGPILLGPLPESSPTLVLNAIS